MKKQKGNTYPIELEVDKLVSGTRIKANALLYEDNTIKVRKGSVVSKTNTRPLNKEYTKIRDRLLRSDSVEEGPYYYRLLKDVVYSSPEDAEIILSGCKSLEDEFWEVKDTP